MLDTSVLEEAVTHTSAWIAKGEIPSGQRMLPAGYLARVQRDFARKPALADQVRALAGLAKEAERGAIEFVETTDLRAERLRHPAGRSSGFGWFDRSLRLSRTMLPSDDSFVVSRESVGRSAQIDRIKERQDQPFAAMVRRLCGHELDTWHVHCCVVHKIPFFLTLDGKFLRPFRHEQKSKIFPHVNVEVLFPSELANRLGVQPVDLHAAIGDGASFPISPELKAPHPRSGGGNRHEE